MNLAGGKVWLHEFEKCQLGQLGGMHATKVGEDGVERATPVGVRASHGRREWLGWTRAPLRWQPDWLQTQISADRSIWFPHFVAWGRGSSQVAGARSNERAASLPHQIR